MLISSDVQGKTETRAYTRAVDMWAVGCVAVVLLTGGLAFCDPVTNCFSETLSKECNLEFLQKSTEWQSLKARPREFVETLLVLDEKARMTADAALHHPWFSNQTHQTEFEELYLRAAKPWHPRTPKAPIVEFMDHGSIKHLSCSQEYLEKTYNKFPRRHRYVPVEEPYKPFPRTMHLALWPKRDVRGRLSDEVLSAIENNWPTTTEPALVRKARMNHLPNSRQSSRPCPQPTQRLRRVTMPMKVQKDLILSRPSFQSSPTMLRMPFRMRMDEKRTSDPTHGSLDANLSGILEGNGTLMPETPRTHRDEENPYTHSTDHTPRPPQPEGRSPPSIRIWKNSSKRQSEIKKIVELAADTHGARPSAHFDADALLSVRPFGQSSAIAGQDAGRTLKRKAPKLDFRVNTKRRRRLGSIYDLSDEDDSDSDHTEGSKKRSLVLGREGKRISRYQPTSNTFYLPR